MSVTIYHNPRCNKSRQTLALLEARGLTPRVIEYLKTPPSAAELKRLLKLLEMTPPSCCVPKRQRKRVSTIPLSAMLSSSPPW